MVDKELLSRKLSRLRSDISELMKSEDINWEKYESDLRTKAFVERYLHLAIEEVLDIANHLISFQRWREPTGYRDLFTILAENGVIPKERLPMFQEMAVLQELACSSLRDYGR